MTDEEERSQRHSEVTTLLRATLSAAENTRTEMAAMSTSFGLHEQANVHEFASVSSTLKSQDSRVGKLEGRAEASGAHDITKLQAQLAERKATADAWKGRGWAIVSALALSGLVGLVTHYLSTR